MFNSFLSGAIVVAAGLIALFFIRFQITTRDKLFGFFAAAFILLGIERLCIEFFPGSISGKVYLIRLLAFLLILFAIWNKNRNERES